ncbi:MAG: DUF4129 domain-containing protein [Ktedonobacteraceae bacterium]|nr:DUF4129 domain-containing protein [Ktedonobacteraceae bacterium]
MDPSPEEDTRVSKGAEKRRQELLEMTTSAILAHPGLSERLLPYLIAAMETCWVDALLIALASMNFFEHRTTLLPLWAPFLFIASSCWLLKFLERRELVKEQSARDEHKRVSGASWFIFLIALLALLVVWVTIYAPLFFFFDPRWLLALLGDLFQLTPTIYYVFVLVVLSIYFCWRGIRLAHKTIEPDSVFWMLRLGMGVIIVAIIAYAGSGGGSFNELILFSIVPLFLFFALVAHALAKVLFLRNNSPGGLQGSVVGQERAILLTMSMIGLFIVLLALGIGNFANPAFLVNVQHGLEPIGRLYDWLVNIIAYGITFLLYPIFWLLSLFHIKTVLPRLSPLKTVQTKIIPRGQTSDPIVTLLLPVLKIVLPVLLIVLMTRAILWLLKRRRIRLVHAEQRDISESIWSWQLFLTQLKAFFLTIWRHFFPRAAHDAAGVKKGDDGEMTARDIRVIYRALLRLAASQGYGRRREETPHEFKERLQQKISQGELELGNLTHMYSELRYGGSVFKEEEITHAQGDWATLQSKFYPDATQDKTL